MLAGDNSILQRGAASKESTIKAQIEEVAKLAGGAEVIDQYTNNTTGVTLAKIISALRNEGYTIEERSTGGAIEVTGIELSSEKISLEKGGKDSITVTLVQSADSDVQYYVKKDGKYYKVSMPNGTIEVSDPVAEIDGIEIPKEEITVSSSDENIAKASINENTITLEAGTTVNSATITVKYGEGGDNFEKECKVIVKGETISTTDSYVGYYADVDGNGSVDGVIFADLAKGNKNSTGIWNPSGNSDYDSYGTYTILVKNDLKSYYISQSNYAGKFGTKDVISLDESGSGTNDRFYVMALTDISDAMYDWYFAAYGKMSDYETLTSVDFGKGKANTDAIIAKWDNTDYGAQDNCSSDKDIWGQIKTEVSQGWFVPSRAEWAAFAGELGIDKSNYSSTYGLSHYYWSSSQSSADGARCANFYYGYMNYDTVDHYNYVRLCTTF